MSNTVRNIIFKRLLFINQMFMKRILLILVFVYSCNTTNEAPVIGDVSIDDDVVLTTWDVATDDLKEGAPYALVNSPQFKKVDELTLDDNEQVVMIKGFEGVKVYPLRYVNFSEVVNDKIDDTPIAITNCPQTKSSICIARFTEDDAFSLKASGYLYHDNQVYTNAEESVFWSQMLLEKIRGDNQYKIAKTYPLIKTVWSTIKSFFPNADVYYREESKSTLKTAKTLQKSSLVLGLIDDSKFENHLYLFNKETQQISFQSNEVLIYTNTDYSIAIPLKLPTIEVILTNDFPNIFVDTDNNTWDVFGFCVSGTRQGEKLEPLIFYEAEEWAWKSFFETITYVD